MYPFAPTPAEVKAQIAQRLDGRPFTDSTIPTESEVKGIIDDVASDVLAAAGVAEIPEAHVRGMKLARYATKVGAAAEVERLFWPEQGQGADTGTYERLSARFEALKAQLADVLDAGGGDDMGSIRTPTPVVADLEAELEAL